MIKLKDILNEASTSESFSQMKNLMSNGIPMMFPKEEGKLQAKYYYKVMQNGDVGVFIQRLSVGDPSAIKLWPKVEKVIKKNIADFYKEDIRIKTLGPVGDIVEEWILKGAYCQTANFGPMDWSSSEPVSITMTIVMDYAILNY